MTGRTVNDTNWPFKHVTGDDQLRRLYVNSDSGAKVGLLIAYFNNQTQDKEVINQKLMWLHLKSRELTAQTDGAAMVINKGVPRGLDDQTYTGDKREFYFWYVVNDKVMTDPYKVKAETVLAALAKGRSNAALVALSTENRSALTPADSDAAAAFLRKAAPYILNYLNDDQS